MKAAEQINELKVVGRQKAGEMEYNVEHNTPHNLIADVDGACIRKKDKGLVVTLDKSKIISWASIFRMMYNGATLPAGDAVEVTSRPKITVKGVEVTTSDALIDALCVGDLRTVTVTETADKYRQLIIEQVKEVYQAKPFDAGDTSRGIKPTVITEEQALIRTKKAPLKVGDVRTVLTYAFA